MENYRLPENYLEIVVMHGVTIRRRRQRI
jgi:hypothetical protein